MNFDKLKNWKADPSKGEVFTPIILVSKILDKIPDEVWRNPKSIFLDPCMGKGTFLIEIVRRLTYIYGYTETDAKSRVYGYDIRVKYINHLHRRGFSNVRHKDFLNDVINMKFDCVVGNPPYQINSSNSNKRAEKLWTKFIAKSNELLKENGILSFVTPTSWLSGSKNIRKGSYGVMELFLENNLVYIEKGFTFENVSIDTHYWVMRKNKNYKNTIFFDSQTNQTKFLDLRNGFFPSDLNDKKISIIEKIFSMESFPWVAATSMYTKWRKKATSEITNTNTVLTYVKGGNYENTQYAYFPKECKPELNTIKKVIVPLSGAEKFSPFIDVVGIPFCCDSYVIPLDDESTLDSVSSIFYSKLFRFLVENYRSSGFVQYPIIKKLPKFDTTRVWTNQELYSLVSLTEDEITYIEANVR